MEKDKVGHIFQFSVDLGNGRSVSLNGNIEEDASEDVMFSKLCKCIDVLQRVRYRAEQPLLRTELATRERFLKRAEEDLHKLRSKRHLTPGDQNQIISMEAHIEKIREDVELGRKNLEEASREVNGENQTVN